MRIIDLPQDIFRDMMGYPGHSKTAMRQHATHLDSFSRLAPGAGALPIDEMPLDLFYGPAAGLDVPHAGPRTGIVPRTGITTEHVRQANAGPAGITRRAARMTPVR
jgi:kynurenine formamidase